MSSALPPGWVEKFSNSRRQTYYFNTKTGETQWERPAVGPQWRASHLLVKHRGSRRPSSWREETITRSKEDALARLRSFEEQIRSGQATLCDLASTESDCSSAKQQGDLGFFGANQMMPSFEKATAALAVGEMSGPVETDSGLHLILRTA